MASTETPAAATTDRASQPERPPDVDRPIGAYLTLSGAYATLTGCFAAWLWRSGRPLPERPAAADLALAATATHKLSRLIAKDRVTSAVRHPFTDFQGEAGPGEVEERARGTGLRRAVGELLICPFCLGLWIASALSAGLIVSPRATRWVASVFSVLFASDLLQIGYKKLEEEL
jgi:hypothetical protein